MTIEANLPESRSGIAHLRQMIDAGRFEQAQALLDADDALAPKAGADLYQLYQRLLPENQHALIAQLCARYLQLNPTDVNALNILGGVQCNTGDYAAARQTCQRVLDLDPANAAALCSMGLMHQFAGEIDQAIDYYKQTLQTDPRNTTANDNLGLLLRETGRLSELEAFEATMIAWDSVLFDQARDRYASTDETVRAAAESVLRNGFVVLRGAINPALVSQVLSFLDSYRTLPEVDSGKGVTMRLSQVMSGAAAEEAFLNATTIELLSEIFGRRPSIDFSKSVLRLVRGDDPTSHVPFHQDMRAFGKMGINVWVPLTPAGGDLPGLQLLPGRTRELIEVEADAGEYSYVKINQKRFRFDESLLVAPVMAPGDCILFLGDVVHRTYLPENRGGERASMELRLFG